MLASIFKHIYRGCDKTAHCPPYTLASWDCQQRTKVLCKEQRRGAMQCQHNDGPRAKRQRSRSSSRCHSRTPSQMGWSRYSCCSPPNMPPRCHSMGEPFSPSSNTTPKLSSVMSVLAYAKSSHSERGVAWASLDDDEDWEEDFQTLHTPVCHMVRQEEGGQGELAAEQMEASGGVRHGGWLPEWTSVRKSFIPWRRSTPTGGHSGGCKWLPKVLGMRRSHGMNCLPHLHQGLRAWLKPWPSILWPHSGGMSRCKGRACAHLLPLSSTLASFLLMRRWRGCGRATLVHGLLLCATKGG